MAPHRRKPNLPPRNPNRPLRNPLKTRPLPPKLGSFLQILCSRPQLPGGIPLPRLQLPNCRLTAE